MFSRPLQSPAPFLRWVDPEILGDPAEFPALCPRARCQ